MKNSTTKESLPVKYKLSKEQQLEAYEKMMLIRRFEERCSQLYGMGLIGGFCHLYIGQEAVIEGVMLASKDKDSIITSYRDHGHAILSGIEPKYVLAELCGRGSGCSKGKGGSMHMFNVAGNFYGGHGIVAAQVPLGTGLAFAEKYLKTSNISFTFLGDGAINQGQVYEAFNMAALWKLPVVYIIENNGYAMGTSVERSTEVTDLYKKGQGFGIRGKKVDGMDVCKVYEAAVYASEFVRDSNGPIILEVETYRYKGHSMSDPGNYRSKDEIQFYKEQDPIQNLKNKLVKDKLATETDLKAIEKNVKNLIQEAIEFVDNSSEPDISELFTDIYKQ